MARDHAAWLCRLGILGERIPGAQTLRCRLRDRGSGLLAELQPLVARLAAAESEEEDEEPNEEILHVHRLAGWRIPPSGLCRI